MFDTKIVEKIKTHILYSINSPENCVVYEKMRKICCSRWGHRWQYNLANALCMLYK